MAGQDRQVTVKLQIVAGQNQLQAFGAMKNAVKEVQSATDAAAKKAERLYGTGAVADIKRVATEAATRVNRSYQTGYYAAHDKLMERYANLSRFGFGGTASSAARIGNFAQGMESMGLSRGASMLTKAAVPLAVAHTAVNMGADAARLHSDKYLTDAQRGRQFFRNNVPGGETIQGWIDSFTGRDARMQEVELNRQRTQVDRQVGAEKIAFDLKTNPMLAGMDQRTAGLRTAGIIGPGNNRESATGELEFRQASRLLPVRRELAKAEREAAVAGAERTASQIEMNKLSSSERSLLFQRAELQKKINADNTSGPERQQMLADMEDVNKRLETVTRGKQAAADTLMGATVNEAEKKRNVRNQQAALAEARAANLEEQAGTAAGGARRIGGMNVMDRGFAVQALKMVQQYGPDAVPPEMLQAAQQIAPDTVGKIVETHGAGTDQFKELQKLAPADFGPEGKSPEQLRKEAQSARDEAENTRVQGEQEFAKSAGEAGKEMARINAAAFKSLIDVYKTEIETAIRIAKGQM